MSTIPAISHLVWRGYFSPGKDDQNPKLPKLSNSRHPSNFHIQNLTLPSFLQPPSKLTQPNPSQPTPHPQTIPPKNHFPKLNHNKTNHQIYPPNSYLKIIPRHPSIYKTSHLQTSTKISCTHYILTLIPTPYFSPFSLPTYRFKNRIKKIKK